MPATLTELGKEELVSNPAARNSEGAFSAFLLAVIMLGRPIHFVSFLIQCQRPIISLQDIAKKNDGRGSLTFGSPVHQPSSDDKKERGWIVISFRIKKWKCNHGDHIGKYILSSQAGRWDGWGK